MHTKVFAPSRYIYLVSKNYFHLFGLKIYLICLVQKLLSYARSKNYSHLLGQTIILICSVKKLLFSLFDLSNHVAYTVRSGKKMFAPSMANRKKVFRKSGQVWYVQHYFRLYYIYPCIYLSSFTIICTRIWLLSDRQ
jgi:hypothetical protein